MPIARVALDVPLPRLFDYSVADGAAAPGDRVLVPFGPGRRMGVVIEIAAESDVPAGKLRSVVSVMDDAPRLPADWLDLARFCSQYYQRPLGEVVVGALPPRLKQPLPLREPVSAYRLSAIGHAQTTAAPSRRPTVRSTLLSTMALSGIAATETLTATSASAAVVLRQLVNAGLVEPAEPVRPTVELIQLYPLTEAQAAAIQTIAATGSGFAAFLLLGVTGSGKTEVYLQLIEATLRQGHQALVLVPEINLTPQLEAQFRSRFPSARIAIMHSALAGNERAATWVGALRGTLDIVLGTRLAVFAPLVRPGLIVVDEEHDASFKQQDGIRYSARDLAVFRAQRLGIPVILGSATPSLESFGNARAGRYRLIELPVRARAGAAMPTVRMLDTRRETVRHGLAGSLIDAINARLARGEQSLIFLNRRGYAPVLACNGCGWISDCDRCAAHLVVHLSERTLRCHHCGLAKPVPRACPSCGNIDLVPFGRGTQRLEDTLLTEFPAARILRIDSDSTRNRGTWEAMRQSIHRGEIDILLGTQILAKGHDFPNLTLVGIINADAALMAADYRAPERLFAQLHQVAGRAGRAALPGEVLIQTRYPEHPLYQALAANDYPAFADTLLADRALYGFPPTVAEAVVRAEAHDIADALAFLQSALAAAPERPEGLQLFDPVAMSLARLAGWERAHVLMQSTSRRALQNFLAAWTATLYSMRAPSNVRWHVDVDPLEF